MRYIWLILKARGLNVPNQRKLSIGTRLLYNSFELSDALLIEVVLILVEVAKLIHFGVGRFESR